MSNRTECKFYRQTPVSYSYIRMRLRALDFSIYLYEDDLNRKEEYLKEGNAFLTHKEAYLKIIPK